METKGKKCRERERKERTNSNGQSCQECSQTPYFVGKNVKFCSSLYSSLLSFSHSLALSLRCRRFVFLTAMVLFVRSLQTYCFFNVHFLPRIRFPSRFAYEIFGAHEIVVRWEENREKEPNLAIFSSPYCFVLFSLSPVFSPLYR